MIAAAAVLVAGGRGRRMGGEPKQLRLLGGRPTMCWAAKPLLEVLTGPLVVVLPEESLAEGEALLRGYLGAAAGRLRVTGGGARRRDSVRAGLDALDERPAAEATVLVHDAVRPFASRALAQRVATRAARGRAVVPAVPLADTLKEVEGRRVVATRDRDRFVAAQTPQAFPRMLLVEAMAAASDADASDCAALCERIGAPVEWVPGEPLNRKLTEPEDWDWAERVLDAGWVRWEDAP